MQKSNKIIYAFIDSQNLNLAIRDQGWVLDFARFKKYLDEKHCITKVYLFIGFNINNQRLYSFLQEAGFVLIFKPCMFLPDGKVKGNVDAELVLHTMMQCNNYHEALVVTGDGDFACLIRYLKENKKLYRLMVPNSKKYSTLLRDAAADKIDFMNNLRNKLEYKKRGPIA